MDPDFAFMMGMATGAVLLAFLQLLLGGRRRRKASSARREAELETHDRGRVQEIAELRERLAVLERIATDPAIRTAAEIEQLR